MGKFLWFGHLRRYQLDLPNAHNKLAHPVFSDITSERHGEEGLRYFEKIA
jgi:hypothetical protein